MAINFPNSPNVNDTHTANDITWKWDGTTWKVGISTINAATIPGISTTGTSYFYNVSVASSVTASTYYGDGSGLVGIAATNADYASVAGIATNAQGLTGTPDITVNDITCRHISSSGIVTASAYYGDGSNLSNVTSTTINNNADNRIITGSGTANTLEGESTLTYTPGSNYKLAITGADSYLNIGTNNKRTEIRNNSNSTYLYSYADSTFHVALAGSGNSIQFDWVSGVMCRMYKSGSVNLFHNNNEKLSTTSTGVNITGIATATHLSVGPGVLAEKFHNDTGGGIQSNYSHDILTYGMVWYGSTNAVGSWTFNLRGNGSTTFNSLINVGETTTVTLYSANNNAANYMTAFKVDGSTITVKWAGGTAPSAATGSGTDVYAMTIMKTADATFTVFGNFTNFA